MKLRRTVILACIVFIVALFVSLVAPAHAQLGLLQSDRLRFRLVSDEPIATADGKTVVNGFKVLVLRDTKTDQCYTTFLAGNAISAIGPSACQ